MSAALEMKGELAALEPGQQRKLSQGVYRAVENSFKEDQQRRGGARSVSVSGDELKRRVNICLKIFRELRGDLGWGLQRAIDHLPRYLRLELDGVKWEPDGRKMWVPGDGA